MGTKLGKDEMKKVQQEIGWSQGIVVSSMGRGGGLALLRKSDLNVTLRFQNKLYIDVLIDLGGVIGEWRLTGFCSHPKTHNRTES